MLTRTLQVVNLTFSLIKIYHHNIHSHIVCTFDFSIFIFIICNSDSQISASSDLGGLGWLVMAALLSELELRLILSSEQCSVMVEMLRVNLQIQLT